jgi:hypothetical protein
MSLETDYTTVPGQVFACISIIGPECPQKNDKFGVKLRGAFPPDADKIEDVHYTNEKLEEIMSGYKENQSQAARMFQERKSALTNQYVPGDENSKFYTKADEPPISHPAEVLERLKKEKPDTPMEELVKEADTIVATEIAERQKKREADDKLADVKEEEE